MEAPQTRANPAGQTFRNPSDYTVSADDIAARIGVTSKTVIRYIRDRKLNHMRASPARTAAYLLRPSDAEAFISTFHQFSEADDALQCRLSAVDENTNPAIEEAMSRNKSLFRGWTDADIAELYSMHGTGGPLTSEGVIKAAERINRNRSLRAKFELILQADEHHVRTLTTMIDAIYKEATARLKRQTTQD